MQSIGFIETTWLVDCFAYVKNAVKPSFVDNHLLSLLNTIPAKYVSGEIATPSNDEMKRIARIYSLLKNEYILLF